MLHIIIKIIVLTQPTKFPQDVISYVHKKMLIINVYVKNFKMLLLVNAI